MSKNSKYGFKTFLGQLKSGIIDQNPTFVQVLGMCPTLATTTSVTNALGMGMATMAVLAFSNLFISLLRKFIPKQVRIAAFIVIISGFVTAVEMLMKAYFTDLYQSLGVSISLIVVNCIILARAEAYASKNKPIPSFADGIAMGLGFTAALTVLAAVRELLGAGTIAGISVLGSSYQPAQIFIMPAGAFITLGCIIALVQKLKSMSDDKKKLAEREEYISQLTYKSEAVVTDAENANEEGGN